VKQRAHLEQANKEKTITHVGVCADAVPHRRVLATFQKTAFPRFKRLLSIRWQTRSNSLTSRKPMKLSNNQD